MPNSGVGSWRLQNVVVGAMADCWRSRRLILVGDRHPYRRSDLLPRHNQFQVSADSGQSLQRKLNGRAGGAGGSSGFWARVDLRSCVKQSSWKGPSRRRARIDENNAPMAPSTLFHPSSRQADVHQQPSAARLAAKAFFSQAPPASELASGEVSIVRRESRLPATEEASASIAHVRADAVRIPTVHRLPFGSMESSPEPAAAVPATRASIDEQVHASVVPTSPRKKRRQLHGEVTIIRAVQPQQVVPDETASSASTPAKPAPRAHVRRIPSPPADRAHGLPLEVHAPRYPQLLAKIRALEALAQAAKRREAIEAIRWIKQAIRTYGLSAQDLGLR